MQINIEKKHVYVLSLLLILVIGTFVYAGTSNYLTGAATSGADDASAFGHDMVCVSAKKVGNDPPTFVGSTSSTFGNDELNNVVVAEGNYVIKCKDTWIMTGCSGSTTGSDDGDYILSGDNGCSRDEFLASGGPSTAWIRCCQIN